MRCYGMTSEEVKNLIQRTVGYALLALWVYAAFLGLPLLIRRRT